MYEFTEFDYSNDLKSPAAQRQELREQIGRIADYQTLLGTTADASAVLLVGLSGLVVRLSEAQTVADVNSAAAEFLPLAQQVVAGLSDGSVNFPYLEKPNGQAFREVLERSTAVAQVMRGA